MEKNFSEHLYLACAVESKCNYLVSGNIGHFAEAGQVFHGVKILSPRAFLNVLGME